MSIRDLLEAINPKPERTTNVRTPLKTLKKDKSVKDDNKKNQTKSLNVNQLDPKTIEWWNSHSPESQKSHVTQHPDALVARLVQAGKLRIGEKIGGKAVKEKEAAEEAPEIPKIPYSLDKHKLGDKEIEISKDTEKIADKMVDDVEKELDKEFHIGKSKPGSFGEKATKKSISHVINAIENGERDIDKLAAEVHKGWSSAVDDHYEEEKKPEEKKPEEKKPEEKKPEEKKPEEKKPEEKKPEEKKPEEIKRKKPRKKIDYDELRAAGIKGPARKEREKTDYSKLKVAGIPGKELDEELSFCKERRAKAKDIIKKYANIDIDDNRKFDEGGHSAVAVVKKLLSNPEFMKLDIYDKIDAVSEMERKPHDYAYKTDNVIKQNDKQDAALIYGTDTIRGCMNNCISCYACKLADGIVKTRFDTPTESEIKGKMDTKKEIQKRYDRYVSIYPSIGEDEKTSVHGSIVNKKEEIAKQIEFTKRQLDEMNKKGIDHTFLRVGVVGDPASNWEHTHKQIDKLISKTKGNVDNILFVSKLQRIDGLDPMKIKNIQVSIDPFNEKHMKTTMDNIMKIKKANPDINMLIRIRSFESKNKKLMNNLQQAIDFVNKNDIPVLETKMRFTTPIADLLEIDRTKYHRPVKIDKEGKEVERGANIKANSGFLKGKIGKYLECDPKLKGCQHCGNCMNHCTQTYPWKKKEEKNESRIVLFMKNMLDK